MAARWVVKTDVAVDVPGRIEVTRRRASKHFILTDKPGKTFENAPTILTGRRIGEMVSAAYRDLDVSEY